MKHLRSLWILSILLLGLSSRGAELGQEEIHDLFSQGKELFRQANEVVAKDPPEARNLYRQADLRFERIANEGGIQNGKLFYNIGNAYSRLGEIGRAILYYRKAEQFIPNDINLQQNLDFARRQRLDKLEAPENEKVMETLFFWHYDVPASVRGGIFLVTFLGVWGIAAVRLFWKRSWMDWTMMGCGLVAACLLASLIVESRRLEGQRPGVVLSNEVVARKGDSSSYESAFRDPLHAGVEFTLVEERSDWLHVRLPDGRECWLPGDSVGMVR